MRSKKILPKSRVTIASRVYLPEPTAASFRLGAVAEALAAMGAKVKVLTASLPKGFTGESAPENKAIAVKRWPVLRDKSGYVRGYLPYMSFDIPLFFRLLFGGKTGVVLVEPPPTTGVVARIATALRHAPYVWYAADVWSDATEIAGAPKPVVSVVRIMEKFAIRGAAGIIAVSEGVAERVRELGGRNVKVIPNGIDTEVYSPDVAPLSATELKDLGITGPYYLYAGTASEWQGAAVFAEAFGKLLDEQSSTQLVFVGQGSEWEAIAAQAENLAETHGRQTIVQLPPRSPETVAKLLKEARSALVSIVPGRGYDFAYPTKVLAALSVGTPVIYAGTGPVAKDITDHHLGEAVDYSVESVARALTRIEQRLAGAKANSETKTRAARTNWVRANRSLSVTGERAASFILALRRK